MANDDRSRRVRPGNRTHCPLVHAFRPVGINLAKEQGTAIAFGIGVWFFFTFLWALVTTMVAYASGVAVGEANDPAWVALEGMLDLCHPTASTTTCWKHSYRRLIGALLRGRHGLQHCCGRHSLVGPPQANGTACPLGESTNAS